MDRYRPDGKGEWIISDEPTTSIILLDPQLGLDRNARLPPSPKQLALGRISEVGLRPMSSWERILAHRRRFLERPPRRPAQSLLPRPLRRLLRRRLVPLLWQERLEERARRRKEVDRCLLDGNRDSLPRDDRISLITSQSRHPAHRRMRY